MMRLLTFVAGAMLAAGSLFAQDPTPAAETVKVKAAYTVKAIYPTDTCVVSGEALDADAVSFEVEGRTFKTCCTKCKAKVEKDPATFAAKLDSKIVAQQLPGYALDTCPISGKKLGSMGEPVQLVLDGVLVQLCCDGCTKKAKAASADVAQKVRDAAFAAQMKSAPATCVVSGEQLDQDAVAAMFGTTLVRTCCKKCMAKVEKDPAKFLAKLAARPAKGDKSDKGDKGHGEHGGKEGKKGKGDKDGGEDCCAECVDAPKPAAGEAKPAASCCSEGAARPAGKTETTPGCCQEAAAKPAKTEKKPVDGGECCGTEAKPAKTEKTEKKVN